MGRRESVGNPTRRPVQFHPAWIGIAVVTRSNTACHTPNINKDFRSVMAIEHGFTPPDRTTHLCESRSRNVGSDALTRQPEPCGKRFDMTPRHRVPYGSDS